MKFNGRWSSDYLDADLYTASPINRFAKNTYGRTIFRSLLSFFDLLAESMTDCMVGVRL